MKTQFTKERFLAITDSNDKIIAIIKCKQGLNDMTKKVLQAIREDYDANSVELDPKIQVILDDYNYEHTFTATIKEEDLSKYEENFKLTFVAVY